MDKDTIDKSESQSANSKCKNCTLEEAAVLEYLAAEPTATQKMIAEKIGKSERTVKSLTKTLQEKGFFVPAKRKTQRNLEGLVMKKETQIVGNTGMYYVCYRLSTMGWNVMPTARNAKGIDIIAYTPNGKNFLGIQVKTLSYRNPVPIGKSKDNIMGDFWCVVVLSKTGSPDVYILTPDEVRKLSHSAGNGERESWWMEPKVYATSEYKDKWKRFAYSQGKMNEAALSI